MWRWVLGHGGMVRRHVCHTPAVPALFPTRHVPPASSGLPTWLAEAPAHFMQPNRRCSHETNLPFVLSIPMFRPTRSLPAACQWPPCPPSCSLVGVSACLLHCRPSASAPRPLLCPAPAITRNMQTCHLNCPLSCAWQPCPPCPSHDLSAPGPTALCFRH